MFVYMHACVLDLEVVADLVDYGVKSEVPHTAFFSTWVLPNL